METCKMTETICTLDPCTYICLTNGGYLVTQATTIYTADYFSCLHPFGKKTTDNYTTNTHANVQGKYAHTHTHTQFRSTHLQSCCVLRSLPSLSSPLWRLPSLLLSIKQTMRER